MKNESIKRIVDKINTLHWGIKSLLSVVILIVLITLVNISIYMTEDMINNLPSIFNVAPSRQLKTLLLGMFIGIIGFFSKKGCSYYI